MRRLAVTAALVAACSKPPTDGGLDVRVLVQPQVKANCVSIAAVKTSGGMERPSNLATRKPELHFGVATGNGLDGEIRLVARGWLGDCSASPTLNAESAPVVATLKAGGVSRELITLELTGALDDGDLDGYRAKASGGVDCDDGNMTVNPEADELCANGLDDDCNGKRDCADTPKCDDVACDDGRACSLSDRCMAGACVGDSPMCNTPTGPCFRLPGQCLDDGGCSYTVALGAACDGGVCASNGACLPAGSELDCTNGIDDNMRDGIDCADPSCLMQRCSDGVACTIDDTCVAVSANGCSGTLRTCAAPPSACHDAGTCEPVSGACVYPVAVGASCDDSDLCTTLDRCQANGTCSGQAKTCTTPPNLECWNRQGTCVPDSGTCAYTVDAGALCNDLDPCTQPDMCNTSGFCVGSTFSCPPPAPCFAAGICRPDAGCGYAPITGGSCDGGFCVAGSCQQLVDFDYVPSNFTPSAITVWSPPVRIQQGCDPELSTNGGGSFARTCMQTLPTPFTVTLADGRQAIVLGFGALVIDANATFTITGDKPVIFAVRGDANIAGLIDASSRRGLQNDDGPGGGYALCGAGVGATGSFASRGGGGGGGAFGSAGSAGAGPAAAVAGAVNGDGGLVPLRGGCNGGPGGLNQMNAGRGGGALQLSVAGTLTLSGDIAASGSGGLGGNANQGGGGGGSGGAILLEGKRVVASGLLLTNGGGGGEGGGETFAGIFGGNGSRQQIAPAPGGGLNPVGGNGANGAAGRVGAGSFVAAGSQQAAGSGGQAGGGGGGGGVGRIQIRAFTGGCAFDAGFSGALVRSGCP